MQMIRKWTGLVITLAIGGAFLVAGVWTIRKPYQVIDMEHYRMTEYRLFGTIPWPTVHERMPDLDVGAEIKRAVESGLQPPPGAVAVTDQSVRESRLNNIEYDLEYAFKSDPKLMLAEFKKRMKSVDPPTPSIVVTGTDRLGRQVVMWADKQGTDNRIHLEIIDFKAHY